MTTYAELVRQHKAKEKPHMWQGLSQKELLELWLSDDRGIVRLIRRFPNNTLRCQIALERGSFLEPVVTFDIDRTAYSEYVRAVAFITCGLWRKERLSVPSIRLVKGCSLLHDLSPLGGDDVP